jgi:branched-chain amino acid transport system substrate-binding protein
VIARLTAATVVALLLLACTEDDDPGQILGASAATTTSTIAEPPTSDGRLKIGVMLPPSASLLRESISLATRQAVDRINEAGGSFGGAVELVPVDEGDTVATARTAIETLLDEGVDAIVGPTSSVIALSTLEAITSADVMACSATAAGLALDDFPDRDLFVRTVPSDSMQAAAIVKVAEATGVQSVTIVYVDDGYGRPFASKVAEGLESLSIGVADSIGFASGDDTELEDEVNRVREAGSGVVILLANSTDGIHFLEHLSDFPSNGISRLIVNDALRSAESSQRLAELPPTIRDKIRRVAPEAESGDPSAPFDPAGPFATQAFDCVTLIALAADFAQSDAAGVLASAISDISTGGSRCRNYAECVSALATDLVIDYDGPSGLTEIGASSGDTTLARFHVFLVDETGNDSYVDSFSVP